MKKRFKTILTVVLSTVIMCGVWAPTTAFAENATGSISINGQGRISIAPDIATIYIGVQTDGVNATTAQQENAETMEAVIKALKENGIDDKDIKTSSYYVNPKYETVYDPQNGRSETKEVGYTVNNYINLTIRDITKIGQLLDTASAAGSNTSYGLSFNISSPEEYYAMALAAAIKNSQEKAEVIAGALGVSVGMPVSVSESGYSSVTPIYSENASYDSARSGGGAASSATTPIELGQIDVLAHVNVVYEYPR